jgi:Sec-independent protein translocase protein TatA
MGISSNLPVDGNALSARAEQATDSSLKEDQKLNKSRRAAASSLQIDKSRSNIEHTKKEADENLQAAKDKTSGGFLGLSIAALIIIAAIVICVVCAPALPVIALIASAAIGAGGLAVKGGEVKGNSDAEDNEAAAADEKMSAGNADLMAKTYEKQAEDIKDGIKQVDAEAQAVRDGARKRRDDQQKFSLQNG